MVVFPQEWESGLEQLSLEDWEDIETKTKVDLRSLQVTKNRTFYPIEWNLIRNIDFNSKEWTEKCFSCFNQKLNLCKQVIIELTTSYKTAECEENLKTIDSHFQEGEFLISLFVYPILYGLQETDFYSKQSFWLAKMSQQQASNQAMQAPRVTNQIILL